MAPSSKVPGPQSTRDATPQSPLPRTLLIRAVPYRVSRRYADDGSVTGWTSILRTHLCATHPGPPFEPGRPLTARSPCRASPKIRQQSEPWEMLAGAPTPTPTPAATAGKRTRSTGMAKVSHSTGGSATLTRPRSRRSRSPACGGGDVGRGGEGHPAQQRVLLLRRGGGGEGHRPSPACPTTKTTTTTTTTASPPRLASAATDAARTTFPPSPPGLADRCAVAALPTLPPVDG